MIHSTKSWLTAKLRTVSLYIPKSGIAAAEPVERREERHQQGHHGKDQQRASRPHKTPKRQRHVVRLKRRHRDIRRLAKRIHSGRPVARELERSGLQQSRHRHSNHKGQSLSSAVFVHLSRLSITQTRRCPSHRDRAYHAHSCLDSRAGAAVRQFL